MMRAIRRVPVWTMVALVASSGTASAFQFQPTTTRPVSRASCLPSSSQSRIGGRASTSARDRRSILRQSDHHDAEGEKREGEEEEEEEYEMVDFLVSPEGIATLRKEAVRRESRKKLCKFFLPPPPAAEEEGTTSEETTIGEICDLFEGSELVEVRGVSRESKRGVFDAAHDLAASLEDAMEKPVVVLEVKGFAARLYCPWVDGQGGNAGAAARIQLRTSYRPGQWTRKPKPIRDERGQIITDENGKSIKEIPE